MSAVSFNNNGFGAILFRRSVLNGAVLFCSVLFVLLPVVNPESGFLNNDWDENIWRIGYFGKYFASHLAFPDVINNAGDALNPLPIFYGYLFYPIGGLLSTFIGPHLALRAIIALLFCALFALTFKVVYFLSRCNFTAKVISVLVIWAVFPLSAVYCTGNITMFVAIQLAGINLCLFFIIYVFKIEPVNSRYFFYFFFTLLFCFGTHPITFLYYSTFIVLIAFAFIDRIIDFFRFRINNVLTLLGIFLVLISLFPWIYWTLSLRNDLSISRLHVQKDKEIIVFPVIDTFLKRFSPIPQSVDLRVEVSGIDKLTSNNEAPYADFQINMPLLILVSALPLFGLLKKKKYFDSDAFRREGFDQELFHFLRAQGYIDGDCRILRKFFELSSVNQFTLPQKYALSADRLYHFLQKSEHRRGRNYMLWSFPFLGLLFILFSIMSLSPNLFKYLPVFYKVIQFCCRMITYQNLTIFVMLIALLTHFDLNEQNKKFLVITTIALTLAFCSVLIRIEHANSMTGNSKYDGDHVLTKPITNAWDYNTPSLFQALVAAPHMSEKEVAAFGDQYDKTYGIMQASPEAAILLNVSEWDIFAGTPHLLPVAEKPFGDLQPQYLWITRPGWVLTNICQFVWNKVYVDGRPLDARYIASPRSFGFYSLAVYLARGSHKLEARFEPPRLYRPMRSIGFFTVLGMLLCVVIFCFHSVVRGMWGPNGHLQPNVQRQQR